MARNEEGEFELVLGNKQLLSVFFILVVLLGVFFTMGYIVGRNNPSNEAVQMATARRGGETGGGAPKEVDGRSPSASSAVPGNIEPPPAPPASEPKTAPPVKEQAKAEPPPKQEERKADPAPKKEEARKKEEPKPAAPAPAPAPAANAGGVVERPTPGSYLQVAAIDRQGAAILADSLRKKSFPALVTPGPNNLFRVVVGPLGSSDEVARTRLRLEEVGIKGSMPRRYKSE